ncbi:battenin isoform X2 [Coccinella septempunctata]|uniref:battenin isoform X2 n=1 Tax=Coccinella septempunctata TaxID=41139 RepID=UPI001D083A30|nr:battenin isoform X2 [Coccinella septempunctata]
MIGYSTIQQHDRGTMSDFRSRTELVDEVTPLKKKSTQWRGLSAYWILGLCNNFGYVVMLTAADDIIKSHSDSHDEKKGPRDCVYLSTGAILLADILPALIVKLLAPFIPFFVHVRVALCIVVACAGFLMVAFSENITMSITGVVLTSFCSGLGEVTFLQYSAFYDKNVVSTWSSGTGGAGVIGAGTYTILNTFGMKNTLLIMLLVPITMGISFWVILPRPADEDKKLVEIQKRVNSEEVDSPVATFFNKIRKVPSLMKFIVPLSTVYLFEYFINQGTFELIKIKNDFVDPDKQYHWLQVDYQIGVFLSRSSVNLFHVRHIWIFSLLQLLNVAVFTTEAIYYYIPHFWIILMLTLWEGLLGGAAYVNTFYRVSSESKEEDKQFSLAATSFADSIGISIAGVISIFAHNKICDMPLPNGA